LALGVALGGGVLELSQHVHGGELNHGDFQTAFLAVGLATLASVWWFIRVPSDAGALMSGHKLSSAEGFH
jgi:hypothetical protein